MEGLVLLQKDLQIKISNGYANFKKSPKSRVTVPYIETRLDMLENYWDKFEQNHSTLIQGMPQSQQKSETYFSTKMYDVVEESYIEYKSDMKAALALIKAEEHTTAQSDKAKSEFSAVKLPKIELPVFSGKYLEWPTFHDLFESLIHNNTSLASVEKLHYLKSYLSGEAEQLLRHISITEANYEKCWQQLKKRYSNKRYIANCILTRLMGQKALTVESSNGVKQLLDTTKDCMNAFSNLGVRIDSWDLIIIHLTNLKLDSETRKQWEQRLSDNSDELPTLKDYYTFLEARFRALEFLEPHDKKETRTNEKIVRPKVFNVTTTVSCPFCSENHLLYQCKKFGKECFTKRYEFVQKARLCLNCFGTSHPVTKCKLRTSCRRCGKRHHSLLHPDEHSSSSHQTRSIEPYSATELEPTKRDNSEGETSSHHLISTHLASGVIKSTGQVLLATALVNVEHNGVIYTLRTLLDQGSEASFITEGAAQKLRLPKSSVRGLVSGLGGDQLNVSVKNMVNFKIQSICTEFSCDVQAYVMTRLSSILPSKKVEITDWSELSGLVLADPGYNTPNKIDLLLGADIYGQILFDGLLRNSPGNLTAQNTQLAWILSGRTESNDHAFNNKVISLHIQDNSTNELLRKFWELETDVPRKALSKDDELCESHYKSNTTRDESGRYVVRLPFRNSDPDCQNGDFKAIALRRFLLLENRLNKNPQLKEQYSKAMNEYVELNHMEAIHDKGELARSDCVYLPHHAVVREDKTTTKVRIVFDASCKGRNGRSLNDDLLVGPRLQPELRHILLNWRNFPICFVADIIKMYRQVKVNAEDTKYQRILWRQNPYDEITEYRMLRVTFGVASAPYLAVKSLQQVADDDGKDFPKAADRVQRDFYMDDFMSGCTTEEEAVEIHHEITELLGRAGFYLQKWASNSSKFMNEIRATESIDRNLVIKSDDVIKILGLTWDVGLDAFKYTVELPQLEKLITKRSVLSDISRFFDPLGWTAPVIIKAKIFMQKLWLAGLTWDELITSPLLEDWTNFRHELLYLNQIIVPRWVHTNRNEMDAEIHGFSDASADAYSAVAYLRVVDRNGVVKLSLLTARTRVAPVKQVSIARLELCGAELLATLLAEISSVMGIDRSRIRAWTDSTIVLDWLTGHPNRWETFVANRVSKILLILDNDQWSHVESLQNPADCASRGLNPKEFINHEMWLQGPKWLLEVNYHVPKRPIPSTTLGIKRVKAHLIVPDSNDNTPADLTLWTKYSSLNRLVRIVAWCKRFVRILKDKSNDFPSFLVATELKEALTASLNFCQSSSFPDEISMLKVTNSVAKRSPLSSLCPFIDTNGVMRVRGRINQSQE